MHAASALFFFYTDVRFKIDTISRNINAEKAGQAWKNKNTNKKKRIRKTRKTKILVTVLVSSS